MKIAILGTKGIPNQYGGFEQFAECLSVTLAQRGHEVTVYNPSFHSYEQDIFKGVAIRKIWSPEKWIGGAANFIYDHLCLKDALRRDFDVIYEAGYHSVAFSYWLLGVRKKKHPVIITNMDGLEWKRSKWSSWVQVLILRLEAIAVRESPYLISDNEGIRSYYREHFKRDSFFLPYGADPVENFDRSLLEPYGLKPGQYAMLMARMEPENNIEMILEGYVTSGVTIPFIVIGGLGNAFGASMKEKYGAKVTFLGGIYDKKVLDALRHCSRIYFHGHSVGGTNPSLLEAMATKSLVFAHDNPFNRGVLGEDARYFGNAGDVATMLMDGEGREAVQQWKENNFQKVIDIYNWSRITTQHEELFRELVARAQSLR